MFSWCAETTSAPLHVLTEILVHAWPSHSLDYLVSSLISSKRCRLCIPLSTAHREYIIAREVRDHLQFTVHNPFLANSILQLVLYLFCRARVKHLKRRLLKCSHPHCCQYFDGYQMNGALCLICTGPLQLNQNQHVFDEFDKTDAM